MSDDIVKRLRGYPEIDECVEAADEIERLCTELAAARERVANLRKALEPFAASAYRADSVNATDIDCIYVVVAHLRHARAVLEETKGE